MSDDLPSRVVCSICLGASLRAEKADPDWLGRQIGRHADRANAALERAQKAEEEAAGLRALLADRAVFEHAQKAEEEAAGLRARLSHYDQIGEAHAAELARVARVTREVQLVREEAAELTRRANDAIPFGPDAPDESQIAAWRDRAAVLLEQAERFEKAIG